MTISSNLVISVEIDSGIFILFNGCVVNQRKVLCSEIVSFNIYCSQKLRVQKKFPKFFSYFQQVLNSAKNGR